MMIKRRGVRNGGGEGRSRQGEEQGRGRREGGGGGYQDIEQNHNRTGKSGADAVTLTDGRNLLRC
eukprot:756272-Hanusia_phi.AAC.4